MKSRINLYLPEFRPVVEPLPLPLVLGVWVIALAVIFMFDFSAKSDLEQARVKNDSFNLQNSQLNQTIASLEQEQANRKQDEKLIADVDLLESDLRAKQILLAELIGREKFKNNGFSQLMNDLAELNQANLWLTSIQVDETSVFIRGKAMESEAVPRWVSGLKMSQYFQGKHFAGIRMFRDENDDLEFVLSTDLISEVQLQPATAGVAGQVSAGGSR